MAYSILHDVLWEGKVASNCVQLGQLRWPNFDGVWKGCVRGSSGGRGIGLKVARSARTVQGFPLGPKTTHTQWDKIVFQQEDFIFFLRIFLRI